MKLKLFTLVACIVAPLSARAVPIPYEFSATITDIGYPGALAPIPPDIQATFAGFRGASIFGTFRYENEVGPPVFSTPSTSFYNGAMLDFVANVAGFELASALGSASVTSAGQDRFALVANPFPTPGTPPPPLGEILGFMVRGFNFAWVEGVPQNDNPVPPFLTDNTLPPTLPAYHAQLFVSLLVPGLTPSDPRLMPAVSLGTLNATVRPVAVPEPSSLALLALGIVGVAARRWRKDFAKG